YEKIPQKLTACAENSIKIHFIRKEVYNCLNNILFTPSPFKSDGWICTLNKKRKTYKIKATTTVDYLYVYPYLYLGDGTKFYYNSMKLEDNKIHEFEYKYNKYIKERKDKNIPNYRLPQKSNHPSSQPCKHQFE